MMRTPFLSNLGVSTENQAKSPTASAFPQKLNRSCKTYWEQAVSELEISDDVGLDWGTALRNYIKLCVDNSQYPFSNLRQAGNDQITSYLQNARRQVVKFMNLSKLLDHTTIKTTRREVLMTSTGFTVSVFGQAYVKDPTFNQWLLKMPYPGFRIKHEGRYHKQLGSGVTMVVYNESANGSQRWHIGYEIICNTFPDLPGKHMPSKGEMERFILDIIWTPILKAHRPYKYHRRLL